jgi:hypothetical protein
MEHDLEKDLLNSQYIKDKCTNDTYAQNLYAALCNNVFTKNEVVPILKEEVWTCSWRYAGGLVAAIRESGDYIDWYCSGIRPMSFVSEDNDELTTIGFVPEGSVTEEIRNDLLHINWIVCVDNEQNR